MTGRPCKQAHNIEGLRNQPHKTIQIDSQCESQNPHSIPTPISAKNPSEAEEGTGQYLDSLRFIFDDGNNVEDVDLDVEVVSGDESNWDDDELSERLCWLAVEGNNQSDETWLPGNCWQKRKTGELRIMNSFPIIC